MTRCRRDSLDSFCLLSTPTIITATIIAAAAVAALDLTAISEKHLDPCCPPIHPLSPHSRCSMRARLHSPPTSPPNPTQSNPTPGHLLCLIPNPTPTPNANPTSNPSPAHPPMTYPSAGKELLRKIGIMIPNLKARKEGKVKGPVLPPGFNLTPLGAGAEPSSPAAVAVASPSAVASGSGGNRQSSKKKGKK